MNQRLLKIASQANNLNSSKDARKIDRQLILYRVLVCGLAFIELK